MRPTTIAVREATVGPEFGTTDVSGLASSTSSTATPSASAAIIGKMVLVPWPISVAATSTRIAASAVSSTAATEPIFASPEPVKPAPCQPSARPIPRATRWLPASPDARARRSGPGADRVLAREVGGLDGALEHLAPGDALAQDLPEWASCPPPRRRSGAGSRPARSPAAPRSGTGGPPSRTRPGARRSRGTRRSAACSWRRTRDRMRTFGQRYGPPAWSVPRESTTGESVA